MMKKTAVLVAASLLAVGTAAYAATQIMTEKTSVRVGDVAFSTTKTTVATDGNAAVQVAPAPAVQTVAVQSPRDSELVVVLGRHGIGITLVEFRTIAATHHLGNGEIILAYNLARDSGRPVGDILRMRSERGMGWGRIAKTLGVRLHDGSEQTAVILRESHADDDYAAFQAVIRIDLDGDDDRDQHHDKSQAKEKRSKGHGRDKD
jgi:hypothetical protein